MNSGSTLRKNLRKLPGWNYLKLLRRMADTEKIREEVFLQRQAISNTVTPPEKKFMMFAHSRSGSGLLRNLLNCHPDIYCDGEVFLRRSAIFPRRYLDNRSIAFGKKVYGYKTNSYQLDNQHLSKETIKTRFFTPDYQVLFLKRRNILKQALSVIISNQRQIWHDTEAGALKGEKFVIDCNELLRVIRWIWRCEVREQELLRDTDYLPICYETDLLPEQMHQQTMNLIFDYLGIGRVQVNTVLHKTLPEESSEFINNYEEIFTTISNSEFAHLLAE